MMKGDVRQGDDDDASMGPLLLVPRIDSQQMNEKFNLLTAE